MALTGGCGSVLDDLAVPLSQFQALCIPGGRVIVVENKMTFLTLPALASGIGIFGGDMAAELLASVSWLKARQIFYWGDLDVHGFHILARLRSSLPHVTCLMWCWTCRSISRLTHVRAEANHGADCLDAMPSPAVLMAEEERLGFAARAGAPEPTWWRIYRFGPSISIGGACSVSSTGNKVTASNRRRPFNGGWPLHFWCRPRESSRRAISLGSAR